MRHRQAYLILALAAALLSACTISEITSSKISFAPVASKATRAIITGTTYPDSVHFIVSAYHEGSVPYFEDQEASYNSTIDLWATAQDQYWPLGGTLTFKAFSPAGLRSAVAIDQTNGVTATDYTIQNTTRMTTDFCYATATVDDCSNHPESVTLTFSHALSQVVFRVKAADYYNDATHSVSITLDSLKMNGIYSVGSFADSTWTPDTNSEYSYSLSNTGTALTYTSQLPDTLTLCEYLFVPQTLGANAALSVGYSIDQTVNSTTFTFGNSPVTIPLRGTITQWLPGRKYIYTLSVGLNNNITFTATTTAWQDSGDSVVVE